MWKTQAIFELLTFSSSDTAEADSRLIAQNFVNIRRLLSNFLSIKLRRARDVD
jgi:hypothetical protein